MNHRDPLDLVRVAAGASGTGIDLAAFTPLSGLWITTRTLTLDPRRSGAGVRIVESASGFVHAADRPNPGLEAFTATELPALVRAGARVLVSVSGRSVDEIVDLSRRLGITPGLAGLEVGLASGASDLVDIVGPRASADLLGRVRAVLPPGMLLHAKLGPAADAGTARAVSEQVDALVVSGGCPALLPDGGSGELVGPAILPVTAHRVAMLRTLSVPLVAVGGVGCAADVLALLDAGADAVQIGSALLHDPAALNRILRDLEGVS